MAFMMKKKKYKFTVEVFLEEITAVPFINGVLFAKVRLLDGGSFIETSSREEVQDHKVKWGAKFEFVCKMSANASTGVLDPCMLRVSVRKELKGGRSFQKLGFTDLNLAEFAGSGVTQRKCLLEGYDTRRRQDNSMLSLTIRMNMLSGDILFKVPSPNAKHKAVVSGDPVPTEDVAGVERRDDFSGGSIASASSGFSSLTKKRPPLFNSVPLILKMPWKISMGKKTSLMSGKWKCLYKRASTTSKLLNPALLCCRHRELLSGDGEEASTAGVLECYQTPSGGVAHDEGLELGHSRNSSNTSQMSKGSGYGSLNSQHSRQSSSGDSGHIRNNGGSASGLVETGSLDRGKAALERRKKAAEEGGSVGGCGGTGRVEFTRVNPNSLIDQLIKATNLDDPDDAAETSGLQLFIAKDGTTALGSQDVKNQVSTGVFKQVVIEENR